MTVLLERLPLPDLMSGKLTSDFADPDSVRDWLVSLPHVQPLEKALSLYDALFTLNRSRLDRDVRLVLVEQFHTAIDMHQPSLEMVFQVPGVPARDRAEQAWQHTYNLLDELALAYRRVLLEETQRRFVFNQQRLYTTLVLKLMVLRLRMLLLCYTAYRPEPVGLWQECHALFQFAMQQKLLDEADDNGRTIAHYYRHLMLLGLSDPYSLLHGEIDRVNDWLIKLAQYATLQPVAELADPAGFFLINLDKDGPPAFMGHRPMDLDGRNTLLLNAIDVVRRVHREMAPLEKVSASSSHFGKAMQNIDLMRRLVRCWGITPQRLFNRMRNNASVLLVVGLTPSYRVLQHSRLASEDVEQVTLLDDDDAAPASQLPEDIALGRWQVINVSPGGYALQSEVAPEEQITVGTVAVLRAEHGSLWNVAVVRWVRQEGSMVRVGLQLLAPSAEPVRLKPSISPADTAYEAGLLLPGIPELKQPPSMIAPAQSFAPLREFDVQRLTEALRVRSVRRMDQGMCVDQFEFLAPAAAAA